MKRMVAVAAVMAGLFLIVAAPTDARGRGKGGGGGHGGGGHSGHGGHGVHRGGGGHGFHGHRFHGHHGHRGHHGFRSSVVIGTGVWVGPYWGSYWYPSYYPYAPYEAYAPTYPVVESQSQSYIEPSSPAPPSSYWYYCEDARAYYPYVRECPAGWLTVVPQTPAGPQR